jgi:hypothetical protein
LDGLRSQCASCHNRKTRIVEQLGEELTVKGCDINATRSTRTILGIEVDQTRRIVLSLRRRLRAWLARRDPPVYGCLVRW